MPNWEEDEDEPKVPKGERGEFCELCGSKGFWMHLRKCPMCHRYVCDDCRFTTQGKDFCSRHCATEIFWGGEDGEIDDG
jgi:hypothetical protein